MSLINEVKKENRPYEKFIEIGPEALSDEELLAIIIRTGTKDLTSVEVAGEVLSRSRSILGINSLSIEELMKCRGIGKVKAIEIKAVAELSKRISKMRFPVTKDFSSAYNIANHYMEDLRFLKTEHLIMVMLNTKYMFIGDKILSIGTVNASIASPREAFISALQKDAVYIVLIHNHPSGDPTPSDEDINTTKRMSKAGKLLGINLLDHIIIGDNEYKSLKQMGIL